MNGSPHSPTVRKSAVVSGLVSAIVAVAFLLIFGGNFSAQPDHEQQDQDQKSTKADRTILSEGSSSVVDVVSEAKPAVVSIIISKDVPQIKRYYQPGPFGTFLPRREIEGFERQQVGSGSGFFVSQDGLIVTNRHVVSDPQASYSAVTNNGQTHDLKVIGRDPFLDIAILQTENATTSFPALDFGSSKQLQPGQKVIAIGNALGEFQNSVSAGVISGLGRSIMAGGITGDAQRLEQVIQTDAAINPGNSGGPLLNLNGEVVGVNVAVVRGSENISFSLPSNLVQEVVESVQEFGEVVRPFLGVRFLAVTDAVAERRDLSVDYGALIVPGPNGQAVTPGSAADEAGIESGDVILSFGDTRVTQDSNLGALIRNYNVGDTVEVTLLRDGERRTVSITFKRAPKSVQ